MRLISWTLRSGSKHLQPGPSGSHIPSMASDPLEPSQKAFTTPSL
jgi:hypothetical protein